jgi:hypothetical protein
VVSSNDDVSLTQFVRRSLSILSVVLDRSKCASGPMSEVPDAVNMCWSL